MVTPLVCRRRLLFPRARLMRRRWLSLPRTYSVEVLRFLDRTHPGVSISFPFSRILIVREYFAQVL